jgi:hypothetical protein
MSTINGMCHGLIRLVVPFLTLSACFVACGGQQRDGDTQRDLSAEFARGSVGACLVHAGAKRATSSNDLQFLKTAEGDEEVSEPGFAYDRKAKIIVSIISQSPSAGVSSEWTVWVAQPFGKSRSPYEIVDSEPPHSYVMFVNEAKRKVRQGASRCITFR